MILNNNSIKSIAEPKILDLSDPLFTLKGIIYERDDGVPLKLMNEVKDDFAQIGIKLDIEVFTWAEYIGQLIAFHEFDLCYVGFSG